MSNKELSEAMREIPELESLLYNLDLMPEQVASDSKEERQMFQIAGHFAALNRRLGSRVDTGIPQTEP